MRGRRGAGGLLEKAQQSQAPVPVSEHLRQCLPL